MRNGIHFLFGEADSNVDFREKVAYFSSLGFDCVELPPDPFVEGGAEMTRDIVRYAASLGSEVVFSCGFLPKYDMASEDPAIRKAGSEYLQKILDVMEAAGIRLLGGTCYTKWPAYRTTVLPPEEKRIITMRTAEAFADAIRTIPYRGITIALEPLNRFEGYLINTAAEGCAFCELVDNPNLGIMLDGFHMSMEEDDISAAIINSSKWLKHLHLAENNRRLPGSGTFPWGTYFSALKAIGYCGRLDIESFVTAGGPVSASVALWRDLSGGKEKEKEQLEKSLGFIRYMSEQYGLTEF